MPPVVWELLRENYMFYRDFCWLFPRQRMAIKHMNQNYSDCGSEVMQVGSCGAQGYKDSSYNEISDPAA